jgi:hypothetical protein
MEPKVELGFPPGLMDELDEAPVRQTNQKTAQAALAILRGHPLGYFTLETKRQRQNLAEAFARHDKPVYGQAYDALRIKDGVEIDFDSLEDVHRNWQSIVLCEIKATNRPNVDKDFGGHFFSMSTAELLVAQKLGENFEFVFVNVGTHRGEVLALTLQQIYSRAQAIYPTWSIRFAPTNRRIDQDKRVASTEPRSSTPQLRK